MIRIARLITYFSGEYGGPVNHILELTKHLKKYPIKTTVYSSSEVDFAGKVRTTQYQEINPNFIIKRFNSYLKIKHYRVSFGLISSLLDDHKNIDIFHSHSFRTFPEDIASIIAYIKNKNFVITPHGALFTYLNYSQYYTKKIYDMLISSIKKKALNVNFIAVSKLELKFLEDFGIDKNYIHYIPHGIDTNHFRYHNSEEIKKNLNLSQNKIILYVGRIAKRKGLDVLIKAFLLLKDEIPEARLLIVGPDFNYRNEIMKLIKKYKIEEKVLFLGFIPKKQMPLIYSMADIVVYPSKYEIFGHVILEANACEKIVIASNHWGPKELIIDGKNGFLTKYGDIEELKEKIAYALVNENKIIMLGKSAREYVKRNYSWELNAESHYNLYKQLLE